MPVLLITLEEWDTWLEGPLSPLRMYRPFANEGLRVVATGLRSDNVTVVPTFEPPRARPLMPGGALSFRSSREWRSRPARACKASGIRCCLEPVAGPRVNSRYINHRQVRWQMQMPDPDRATQQRRKPLER
jgi:hypothetical protein